MSAIYVKLNKSESRALCAEDIVSTSACFWGFEFAEAAEIVLHIDLKAASSEKRVKAVGDLPGYKEMQLAIEAKKGRIHYAHNATPGKATFLLIFKVAAIKNTGDFREFDLNLTFNEKLIFNQE